MLRTKAIAVVLAGGLMAMTGCSSDGGGWFVRDPDPSPSIVEPDTCDAPGLPAGPVRTVDPTVDKPLDTPPGNSWITYGLRVTALSPNMLNDYCVPIHVTYTKRVMEPDLVINGGTSEGTTLDFYTTTPWQGYVSFDYNPADERLAARPPTYQISLQATYLRPGDTFHGGDPLALACDVQLAGAAIKRDLVELVDTGTCEVTVTDNRFNLGG